MRYLVLLILICFTSSLVWTPAWSQSALLQASPEEYQAALHSTKLVRNKNTTLPVAHLPSLKVSTLFDGCAHADVLRQTTDTYCAATHATGVPGIIDSCNFLILGLGPDLRLTNTEVRGLVEGRSVVAMLFHPDIYNQLPDIVRADAIIHAFDATELTAEIVIQQIFGGTDFAEVSAQVGDIHRLGYAPPASAGMDYISLRRQVDSIVEMGINRRALPGAQVLVARRGKIVFHEAYGYHTYDSLRASRLNDIYDIASITKIAATTAAVMRLYDEGRFDLDATVGDYYPDFANTNKASLRWREVLAHQAGLKPWIPFWRNTVKRNGKFKWFTFKSRPSRRFPVKVTDSLYLHRHYRKKILRAIAKSPVNIDTGYVYSGLSFYILPEIVERRSSVDFETLLRKDIYEPLGATTIGYHPRKRFALNRIVPTERDTFFRKAQLHGYVHDEGAAMMGGLSGNAGFFSDALDLARFAQLLLNGGVYGGERIFSETTVDEFTRCQFCASGNHRGLGFDKPFLDPEKESVSICKAASPQSYGHSGYTGTLLWVDPAEELIFIFLSNRVYPTRLNRKLYTLNIRPAIHQAIYDAIVE